MYQDIACPWPKSQSSLISGISHLKMWELNSWNLTVNSDLKLKLRNTVPFLMYCISNNQKHAFHLEKTKLITSKLQFILKILWKAHFSWLYYRCIISQMFCVTMHNDTMWLKFISALISIRYSDINIILD